MMFLEVAANEEIIVDRMAIQQLYWPILVATIVFPAAALLHSLEVDRTILSAAILVSGQLAIAFGMSFCRRITIKNGNLDYGYYLWRWHLVLDRWKMNGEVHLDPIGARLICRSDESQRDVSLTADETRALMTRVPGVPRK